jgi:hypothetical protein
VADRLWHEFIATAMNVSLKARHLQSKLLDADTRCWVNFF